MNLKESVHNKILSHKAVFKNKNLKHKKYVTYLLILIMNRFLQKNIIAQNKKKTTVREYNLIETTVRI